MLIYNKICVDILNTPKVNQMGHKGYPMCDKVTIKDPYTNSLSKSNGMSS